MKTSGIALKSVIYIRWVEGNDRKGSGRTERWIEKKNKEKIKKRN